MNVVVHPEAFNTTASSSDLVSASQGIQGGYEGNSFTIKVLIILFPALSMYNVLELTILIFSTFTKWRGLYFWSLLIASLGIIPYSLGFLFKFNNITHGKAGWLDVVLLTIGWYTMVTGQAVVLWSRLHLILGRGRGGQQILQYTKWMIIVNVFILHVPTSVLTFGSNGNIDTANFVHVYNIMEKIQMSGFFIQEFILSTIYIVATVRIIRTSPREDTKKMMYQLFAINVTIIIMDLGLLGMEAASLYLLETITKGVFYSIKLKLEFAILGKLVSFVGGRGTSIANEERNRQASITFWRTENAEKQMRDSLSNRSGKSSSSAVGGFSPGDLCDFVDFGRTHSESSQPSYNQLSKCPPPNVLLTDTTETGIRPRGSSTTIRIRPGISADDVDIAMFEHSEDVSIPLVRPDQSLLPPVNSEPIFNDKWQFHYRDGRAEDV